MQQSFGFIRDVERELAELQVGHCRVTAAAPTFVLMLLNWLHVNIQVQLRVNVGPKKHALEMLRRKIEVQNERVMAARRRRDELAKALAATGVRGAAAAAAGFSVTVLLLQRVRVIKRRNAGKRVSACPTLPPPPPWPAEETLGAEERVKEQLCQELGVLINSSASSQMQKLEQLTQR